MWSGHTDDSLCMCGFHIPPTNMYWWLSGDCDGCLPHLQHMSFCLFVCFVCLAAHSLSLSVCPCPLNNGEEWGMIEFIFTPGVSLREVFPVCNKKVTSPVLAFCTGHCSGKDMKITY